MCLLIKHAWHLLYGVKPLQKEMKSGTAKSVGDDIIKNREFFTVDAKPFYICGSVFVQIVTNLNFMHKNPSPPLFPCQIGNTARALLTLTWSRITSLLRPATSSWSCAVLHPWSSTPACQTWKSWGTKQRTFLLISTLALWGSEQSLWKHFGWLGVVCVF